MDRRIYGPGPWTGERLARRIPKGRDLNDGGYVPPTDPRDPNSNPVPVQLSYGGADVAPHGGTERVRYTVPQGRRAQVQSTVGKIIRKSAAAPVGETTLVVRLFRAGDESRAVSTDLIHQHMLDNTVGARDEQVNPGPVELYEGDVLLIRTADNGTGGLVSYGGFATIIEYDAVQSAGRSRSISLYEQGASGSGGDGSLTSTSGLPLLGYAPDPRYPWR